MSEHGTEDGERSTGGRLRALRRPGVAGSLLLHAAVLGFLLYEIGVPPVLAPLIPIDLVQLAEETATAAPQADAPPVAPTESASRQVASVAPPRTAPAVRPEPVPAPPPAPLSTEQPAPEEAPPAPADPLQSQLEALAKLRIQNGPGGATGLNAPLGARTGYRVEDLIRAQVQRRWNLRLDELGERELTIAIHVVLDADGTVLSAEIADAAHGRSDEVYRSIALSARNAVLLSSPLSLPAGMTEEMRDLIVSFRTRDMMR